MVDRTHAYIRDATNRLYGNSTHSAAGGTISEDVNSVLFKTAYFAPVLPLENTEQLLYLADLETGLRPYVSGLALYNTVSLSVIPESLSDLPRLLFSEPATPHEVLRDVALGADLLTIPFVNASSDAGIALDFVFPAQSRLQPHSTELGQQDQVRHQESESGSESPNAVQRRPLAHDMWSSSNTIDLSPLADGCKCYTCKNHHRAYLFHLLSAKEMLAWTLLQIHNHHILDAFFDGIRTSIERGTFDEDTRAFYRLYDSKLPETAGEGPRLRGYQLPASRPHQPRRFPKVYGRLDDAKEKSAESQQSSIATPDTAADGLEERGFAAKQA